MLLLVVVHVCRFLERPRPQVPGSSCLHSLVSFPSFSSFSKVAQSLETISALAANARDQLGSQESGVSKSQGEEGSLVLKAALARGSAASALMCCVLAQVTSP